MSGSSFKRNRGKYSRTDKKTKLEKEINKLKKPGKTYTKAQLLALKRKAQGKTISQVKAENETAMRKRAAAKNATFKAAQKLKIKTQKDKKKKKNNTGIGYSDSYPKLLNLK